MSMPSGKTPYKRGYHQSKAVGRQSMVSCAFCGKTVPRFKTFTVFRGFSLTDPAILKQVDRKYIHTFHRKMYACPSCARHRGIVKKSGN